VEILDIWEDYEHNEWNIEFQYQSCVQYV